jgi:hypothetical protein
MNENFRVLFIEQNAAMGSFWAKRIKVCYPGASVVFRSDATEAIVNLNHADFDVIVLGFGYYATAEEITKRCRSLLTVAPAQKLIVHFFGGFSRYVFDDERVFAGIAFATRDAGCELNLFLTRRFGVQPKRRW